MAANAGYYALVCWQLIEKFWHITIYEGNINSSVADMISSSTLINFACITQT